MRAVFITGTDTSIGKTYVASLLLQRFNRLGYQTFAIKPIASGCEYHSGQLQNDDAVILQKNASILKPYHVVNPIALKESVAPHLAAAAMNIKLSKQFVMEKLNASLQQEADINIIEGVGGWSVPLNNNELFSEVIAELNIPVILVVGIKLGCLNHAILTYINIINMQVPLVGWIANCLEPQTLMQKENIQTLTTWIKQPCLGVITNHAKTSECINIDILKQRLFD